MLMISWNLELKEEAVLGVSYSRLALAVPGQVIPVAMINDVLLTSLPVTGHKIAGKKLGRNQRGRRQGGAESPRKPWREQSKMYMSESLCRNSKPRVDMQQNIQGC